MSEFPRVFQDIFVLTQNYILSIKHHSGIFTKNCLDNQILRQQNWYESQSYSTFVLAPVRLNEGSHLCPNDGCSLSRKSTQGTSIMKCNSNEIDKKKKRLVMMMLVRRAHKMDHNLVLILTKFKFSKM